MQIGINTDIDFDELDSLIAEDSTDIVDPPVRRRYQPRERAESVVPSELAPAGILAWRFIKNTAPQVAADVMALGASSTLAALAVKQLAGTEPMRWQNAAVAALPLICAYWLRGLYSAIGVHPVTELREVVQLNTIALGAAALGTMLVPGFPLWCILVWCLSVALVPLLRNLARRLCAQCAWWGAPALIISSGQTAHTAADVLMRSPTSGLRPVLLTDPTGECKSASLPVENHPEAVARFIGRHAVRHAVIWLPDLPHNQIPAVVDQYRRLIPHLMIASDSAALPELWRKTRNFGGFAGTELRNGHMLAPLQIVKRTLDITIAGIALLVGAPLMAALAVLVKLTSPGAVLFHDTRVGAAGRLFYALKFRTMYIDSAEQLARYLRESETARREWELYNKLRDDPRVTPLGKYLRRLSLDELPQLWNVIRGDMSIVGPRPLPHTQTDCYGGNELKLYTSVRPGLTGLWQVSGRNNTTFEERVRFDAYYVRNWSPWLDILILVKTVVALICRTGAC